MKHLVAIGAFAALSWTSARVSAADSSIGLGIGLYSQDSTRDFESESAGEPFQQRDDQQLVSDDYFNLGAWWLTPAFSDNWRVGAGLFWFNNYTLKPKDAEDPSRGEYCDQQDCYRVGHLIQLQGNVEYRLQDVLSELDVALGGRVGILMAFPKGELGRELDNFDAQGYDVFPSVPRLGGMLSPFAALMWPLSKKLDLRGEGSVQFSRLGLYDTEAETVGPLRREASGLSTTRFQFVVGVELHL